ncbi:DUF4344 domain-containing metallopeptidase [Antarcticirhabdus aurantiaca]|uniref:DUF4344 domain-containing metallopeptidase n=1 Tax=Antarcticirhabdus aurantiaca TaxID=2606717 RepID=A0ACD4NK54_9HYPH|nr:DUF4344 domain-containing metallopeptidase [Antarcticirhabdus aurantiaca]WAJ27210.1 DUF4344 domain-containing metallopeptidase [Jeongeuplla avenae]
MRITRALFGLPVLAALACSLPALAQEDEAEAARAYARDNTVFTLYHELGHLFVDRFSLPVLAREEDAVDNLATLLALEDYDRSDDGGVLGYAVYGWELAVNEDGEDAPDASTLYDVHSLNAQRAFTMVCLLVGKDKAVFGEAATSWGMDDERQDGCAEDYAQAKASWDMVLKPHRVAQAGPGASIEVVYEPASAGTAGAKQILRSGKVLERFAARMEAEYSMPEDVVLKAADCGTDNAYYDSSEGSVTVCYELVDYYVNQYMQAPGEEVTDEEASDAVAEDDVEDAPDAGEEAVGKDGFDAQVHFSRGAVPNRPLSLDK